jgi:hypothetical protein
MDDQQLSEVGEQLRMLASIALGRKVHASEDLMVVNAELRQQYEKLPDRGQGIVDRLRMGL